MASEVQSVTFALVDFIHKLTNRLLPGSGGTMSTNKTQNDGGRKTEFAGLLAIMFIGLLGVLVGLFLGALSCGVGVNTI